MINATKEKLASYFMGSITYEVPFFQRSYVWNEENWQVFWEHTITVLDSAEKGANHEHFIGTIITKQRDAKTMGQTVHDLIDGQQRLTTVALFLKAIRDRVNGDMPRLRTIIEDHLWFENAYGTKYFRITHSKYDRPYFMKIMEDAPLDSEAARHAIPRAYRYFYQLLEGFPDERLERLRQIILEKIPIISMMLASTDDEQEIFDSINSLGVRLTTGELLKNFIFMEKSLQDFYDTLWAEPFEASEEIASFWDEPKTAGRIIRSNIEVLLYCYLIIKSGKEVQLEKLFGKYKEWLKGIPITGRRAFLEELKGYAAYYAEFPSGQELNQIAFAEHEKLFFHVLENLSITTAYPLVLYIYRNVGDKEAQLAMLRMIESYLVRRNVCRYTTKNYNQLFIQIINSLERLRSENGVVGVVELRSILTDFNDPSNQVPDDESFRRAFLTEPISNQNAKEILYCLALYQSADGLNDVPRLSSGNYSVEHILPQKWEEHWLTGPMNADEKANRYEKLRTLGNLTLVTKKLNSTMQNSPWKQKKEYLRPHSSLRLTTDYLSLESWDEDTIETRAQNLAEIALKIWPF